MMGQFLLLRFSQTLLALSLFSVVVFGLSRAAGDPVRLMVPLDSPPETVEQVRQNMGLDRPLPVQLLYFYRDILSGDFGTSLRARVPVGELLAARLPASLQLGGFAMLLAVLLAFPLAVTAAARRNSRVDHVIRIIAAAGLAMPSFWFGLLLIGVFAVFLRLLPAGGSGGFEHLILPGLTMAMWLFASLTRLLRSSLLEVIGAPYVVTAQAKGLPRRLVLWRHVLRNALLPTVTFAGTYMVSFISAAVVVETVFAWPGIGRLALDAVQSRDYPVMQALMLTTAAFAAAMNVAIDVSYALLDPRIRLR